MDLSLHDFVVEHLEACRGTWPEVARATGLSKRTIEKIARREIADPGVSHIEKLAAYFRRSASAPAERVA
jgi:transcriptional regulator with XRE-family HTH domain